ncbi:MAG: dTDP-4-dehydrorhamnose reductase [Bacteroidetes bacterium]|jgi:dTDP-4-dehydrorhamnose reductase|nr:dTDP-4-dehydrorhamnose reductase [Bacteroidota bacterium]
MKNISQQYIYPRILLTGGTGQLGWELKLALKLLGAVWTPIRQEFDLANPESLRDKIRDYKPDLIVNPGAYTAVDQAESESDRAYTVNADAPGVLAEEANRLKIPMIHYSTDYVFDGTKGKPYTEKDKPNPLNVYGSTKLAGELAIQQAHDQYLILRTSWLYSLRRNNFLMTMRRLLSDQDSISVVADQQGTPTWARTLAETSALALEQLHKECQQDDFHSRILHLVPEGNTNWFEFARIIAGIMGGKARCCRIRSIKTDDYPTAARRPADTRLSNQGFQNRFMVKLPEWEKALHHCMNDLD